MKLFRLIPSHHAYKDDGGGGLFTPGRWHRKGVLVLYFSTSPSLSLIEKISRGDPLASLHLRIVDVEESHVAAVGRLPKNWDLFPDPPGETRNWGVDMLKKHHAFMVPSAIIPMEFNVVARPDLPFKNDITVPFKLDSRTIKALNWDPKYH